MGLIPSQRVHGETHYAFPDLTVIRQADAELAEGVSFRAVLRNLLASRAGQLAFDFPRRRAAGEGAAAQAAGAAAAGGADGARACARPVVRRAAIFVAASTPTTAIRRTSTRRWPAYRRALEIDPYLVPALINLANIHYARDEIAEAQALYERAIALEADVFEAHFNLGNILHDLGRYNEAQACYRDALRLEPGVRRRAFLSGGDAGEERAVAGGAAALARLSAAGAQRRVGAIWRRNSLRTSRQSMARPISRQSVVLVVRRPLLRRAAQLVVLAVRAPRVGVEAGRAGVRLHLAVRAERRVALFLRLLPAAGIEARERRRLRGVRGAGRRRAARSAASVAARVPAMPRASRRRAGSTGSLLKLYANGLLQRAKRAHFFGSDQRQRAPR